MLTRPDTRHYSFAVFGSARQKKSCTDRRTHVRTDGHTDGQADGHPLVESWLTTKNNYEDGEGAQA